jgi:glucose/arabinose dehydrogenase
MLFEDRSLRRVTRRASLWLVLGIAAIPASTAAAQEPEAHVLIYSGTVAHRHADTIAQGIGPIQDALDEANISYDWEDCGEIAAIPDCDDPNQNPRIFTPENLAQYDAIFLFNAGGNTPQPLWNQSQRDAIQGFVNDGGGIAANHLATDMGAGQVSWGWWDGVGNSALGTTMPAHPAAPQTATAHVSDRNHPSTRDLPDTIQHSDEHYSFDRSVRGTHHVLVTLDETSYDPLAQPHGGGNPPAVAMGNDHPISWCRLYDGGRIWATSMGHFANLYTANGGDNYLIDHLVGGIQWVAGVEGTEGDCGGTVWSNFRRTVLSTEAEGPIGLEVANDGTVYWTEIGPDGLESFGRLKKWDPETGETSLVGEIETRADSLGASEDGVLGMELDPDFDTNRHVYIYYSPRGEGEGWPMAGTGHALGYNRLSRFTLDAEGTEIVAEQPILDVPKVKVAQNGDGIGNPGSPNWPAHTGGAGLNIDSEGNLYLGVGDDVNPFGTGQNGYAPMDQQYEHRYDARNTAANTNDLRGKILRIDPLEEIEPGAEPGVGETYAIPEDNMFEPGTPNTRPEIYAMGFRQPFTVRTDPAEPGTIVVGEYGPDSGTSSASRGPAGIIEWNHITEPGFFGWPFCTGDTSNENSYNRFTYPSGPSGERYDCSAATIPNESEFNTGLDDVPGPAVPADIWHKRDGDYPEEFGIPTSGVQEPNTGPIYRYDPDNPSDTKWPAYYDGSWLILDRSNNWWREARIADNGEDLLTVNQFFQPNQFGSPNHNFPIPIEFGPDGALYMGLWTGGCCRALSENPAQIIRIDYVGDQEDEDPPTVEAEVSGPQTGDGDFAGRATLEVTATDGTGSGVDRVEYSLDDGATWTELPNDDFAEPFTGVVDFDEPGDYEVAYRAFDRDGNASTEGEISFTVLDGGSCVFDRSDEFDSGALDTDRWTVRVDEPGFEATVEDGALVLPVLDEIDGVGTGPLALVSQQVPEGDDWSVTTRVTIEYEINWEQAGLMLWVSDGNFVKVGFTGDDNTGAGDPEQRRFEITADDPTDVRHFATDVGVDADFPATAWIRMFREGNTIRGAFAPDEGGAPGQWTTLPGVRLVSGNDEGNEIDPPREGPGVMVGPYAGGNVGGPWNNTAAFDFVRFEPDTVECEPSEDEVAPVTTVQLNGADPVGSYDGPVEVAMSAEDNPGGSGVLGTEYSLDGGAFEAYTGPFTVSAEGSHEVEFFSTDVAGNEEAAKSVEFEISGAAGSPELGLNVKPKRKSVSAGRSAKFTATVRNAGDGPSGEVRVCVDAPKSKMRIAGKPCANRAVLEPGARAAVRFRVEPNRSARGKRVKLRFSANSPPDSRARATAILKVRR